MTEISIIKIDGRPLEKLFDVISKGVGTLYKPRAIRKEAAAKAYEIEIIERARANAIAEGKEIEFETIERIQERLLFREFQKQKNIDSISQIASEQIGQEKTVSEEPVDQDWTTRFFNIVEDISDEEMQKLWGRVLAGEVTQPKSYSLRTLELLKNLSRNEAQVFTKASHFVISSYGSPFIFKGSYQEMLTKYGLSFDDRLLLSEVGLLQSDNNIARKLNSALTDKYVMFTSGQCLIKVIKKANSPVNRIEILRFTKIGEELLKLLNPITNEEYIGEFLLRLKEFDLEVEQIDLDNK